MALKRKNRIEASFSMASMTDVIFLLLIFFMVTSTFVFPNAIKVNLPQSKQREVVKPLARVTIDASLNYYVSVGKSPAVKVPYEELSGYLVGARDQDPDTYFALYADESVPYREIIKILNIAGENQLPMVLATQPLKE
ncbi:MAG: biopolymer transporter ExbD [Porphyromonadaceae bacterium]|nr:biopolymer transporter ExbD [Porphyromonadaceae bacterium]